MKLLSALSVGLFAVLTACQDTTIEEDIHSRLMQEINGLRARGCTCGQDKMPPVAVLIWNDTLAQIAHDHAADMYAKNYLSHNSQDGTPPIIRAQKAGYTGTYVGENIARGYDLVTQVMQGWIASEDHCKNMMDATYTEMGAAKVSDYWDIDFGGH